MSLNFDRKPRCDRIEKELWWGWRGSSSWPPDCESEKEYCPAPFKQSRHPDPRKKGRALSTSRSQLQGVHFICWNFFSECKEVTDKESIHSL